MSRQVDRVSKAALASSSQEAIEQLNAYMRKTAAVLAALHQSGVQTGETLTLDEYYAELHDLNRATEPDNGLTMLNSHLRDMQIDGTINTGSRALLRKPMFIQYR